MFEPKSPSVPLLVDAINTSINFQQVKTVLSTLAWQDVNALLSSDRIKPLIEPALTRQLLQIGNPFLSSSANSMQMVLIDRLLSDHDRVRKAIELPMRTYDLLNQKIYRSFTDHLSAVDDNFSAHLLAIDNINTMMKTHVIVESTERVEPMLADPIRPRSRKLVAAPASKFDRFAELWFSRKTYAKIIYPAIADMQEEYFEALQAQRLRKAKIVLVRGYCCIMAAIVAQLIVTPLQAAKKLWNPSKG